MTRGHNIVADGWAGAANPYPHPTPHPTPLPTPTHTQKQKSFKKASKKLPKNSRLPTFLLVSTDGPMDSPSDVWQLGAKGLQSQFQARQ